MNGKTIGYIRVSTVGQNAERQLDGVSLDKVFEEKVSAKTADRRKLKEMLEFIREGDVVVVHDISRLARNIQDLHSLVGEITAKGVTLKFLKEGLVFTGDKTDAMSLSFCFPCWGLCTSLKEASCWSGSVRGLLWLKQRASSLDAKQR